MIDRIGSLGKSTTPPPLTAVQESPTPEAARQARQCWREVIDAAGSQYAGATLDSFRTHGDFGEVADQQVVLDKLRTYCQGFPGPITAGRNVLLLGPCGTGKDHLMLGMVREAIRSGIYSIQWVDAAETFGSFKDALAAQQNVGELLTQLIRPQLLVISDLVPGDDPLTTFESDILFRLLNARGRRQKATWCNANVRDREQLSSKILDKCVSRLYFDGLILKTQWSDYRRIAK